MHVYKGELRADWRALWIVIYFPPTFSPPALAGIDILSSQDEVGGETLEEVRLALAKLDRGDEDLGKMLNFITCSAY